MKIIKNRKMKGTVLLTVVSVMALMIVFMTTTLVLANAANKRAHRSYSVSQAEYTARAAIENFTEAMSRNPDVAAAVYNGVRSVGDEMYPSVVVGDPSGASLGHVGYYDNSGNFVPDTIKVENVGTQWGRADTGSGEQWMEMSTVRINATARVGKEEKTVCAYIKKLPSSRNPDATKVKGLNTAGDAKFPNGKVITGGLGIGLKEFKTDSYDMTNEITIDTTLSFINGGLRASTSTFHAVARTDVSETIIMGDLWVKNDSAIDVEYTPTGTYTQKNTPYLFVLGNLSVADKFMVKSSGGEKPYNVFAGTCTLDQNPSEIHADLYLTDPAGTSSLGQKNTGGHLYSWSDALINGTTQFRSNGGSVYCRGNLTLASNELQGDLRVDGDLTIVADPCEVYIHGDIVCGGTLTVEGPKLRMESGKGIYCDTVNGTVPVTAQPFANYGQPAYPVSMRLESILGTIDTTTGKVNPVAPPETKIIKTLEEVRKDLGYDSAADDFNYAGSVADLGPGAVADTGYNEPSTWIANASGTIDHSCTITSFAGDVTLDTTGTGGLIVVLKGIANDVYNQTLWNPAANGGAGGNETITITSSKAIQLNNGHKITVKGADGVTFFIDGDLFVNQGQIVYDGMPTSFDYTQKIPIEFYGAEMTGTTVNSRILMTNPCLMMGSFKMPWTDIAQSVSGPTQYSYLSDTGKTYTGKPTVIGNALFHDILNTQNEFEMYYTEAGTSSHSGGFSTAIGYWDVDYFSGS